jgi:hypothetical protein
MICRGPASGLRFLVSGMFCFLLFILNKLFSQSLLWSLKPRITRMDTDELTARNRTVRKVGVEC